jgi:pilus assembly protein FimV
MLRKTSLAVAIAFALTPALGYALGLGDLRSSSLMNNVFEGDIELTGVSPDEVAGVKARLASPEAFKKAGVDYSGPVKRLRFKPYVQANGRPAIRVTSTETVREPFLNFLVEVAWPQGRTVKEFTALLDPPTFTERRAPQVEAPVAAPREPARPAEAAPRAAVAPSSAPPAAAPSPAAPPAAAPAPVQAAGETYGPVRQGETLWRIAERRRSPGVSAEQAMMAILKANPDAFIGGNINRLKAGARLRLPDSQQIAGVDAGQARDDYLRQMGRPVPERRAARAPAAPAAAPSGDLVRLVTPAPTPTPAAEPAPAAVAPDIRQDVLLAHEKAESARQTADQLQGRVSDLESQLRDMQRLLVLKDTQLAQLQQRAEEAVRTAAVAVEKAESRPPPPVAEPKSEAPAGAAPIAVPSAAQAPTRPVETPKPVDTPKPVEVATPAEAPKPVETPKPVEVATPVEAPKPAESAKPVESPAPAPAAPEPRPEAPAATGGTAAKPSQPAGLMALLEDPANALGAGLAGLGVLGALLWAIVGRRRGAAAGPAAVPVAIAPEAPPPSPAVTVPAEPSPGAAAAPAPVLPAAAFSAVAAVGAQALAKPAAEERVATEDLAALDVSTTDLFGLKGETTEVDPLEEADVYIAYGRFEQAEQLLKLALEMEPGRLALQHKLLEVYAAARDVPAFGSLFARLEASGRAAEDPAAWERILRLGQQLDPQSPAYAGAAGAAEPVLDDALGRARQELAADLDRVAGKDIDFGELNIPTATVDTRADDIDAGSVLNDLSLDLGTEDAAGAKSTHPFHLDVTEELKEPGAMPSVGTIDVGEALAWGLDGTDATGLVETEIRPVEVTAEQLDDAAREVPDLGDLEIGPDTALELGGETTLMHADTTLELVDDVETKLDLARAYVELGDQDSARLMLQEAMQEGNAAQKAAAEALLKELG